MSTQATTQDTTREAELILLELTRSKPPIDRLRDACSASQRVVVQCKNAIRRMHPDFSDDEIKLRFIELNYGKQLADEVRSWVKARQAP